MEPWRGFGSTLAGVALASSRFRFNMDRMEAKYRLLEQQVDEKDIGIVRISSDTEMEVVREDAVDLSEFGVRLGRPFGEETEMSTPEDDENAPPLDAFPKPGNSRKRKRRSSVNPTSFPSSGYFASAKAVAKNVRCYCNTAECVNFEGCLRRNPAALRRFREVAGVEEAEEVHGVVEANDAASVSSSRNQDCRLADDFALPKPPPKKRGRKATLPIQKSAPTAQPATPPPLKKRQNDSPASPSADISALLDEHLEGLEQELAESVERKSPRLLKVAKATSAKLAQLVTAESSPPPSTSKALVLSRQPPELADQSRRSLAMKVMSLIPSLQLGLKTDERRRMETRLLRGECPTDVLRRALLPRLPQLPTLAARFCDAMSGYGPVVIAAPPRPLALMPPPPASGFGPAAIQAQSTPPTKTQNVGSDYGEVPPSNALAIMGLEEEKDDDDRYSSEPDEAPSTPTRAPFSPSLSRVQSWVFSATGHTVHGQLSPLTADFDKQLRRAMSSAKARNAKQLAGYNC